MAPLRVPDDGLLLSGSPGESTSFPSQAFAISLDDDVIEDLVRCFENGEGIQLSLGSSPAFLYGGSCHTISRTNDDAENDIYLTQPFSESIKRARKVPNTMSIWKKPKNFPKVKPPTARTEKAGKSTTAPSKEKSKAAKSGTSSGLDSDLEALQNSLARAEAQKGQALVVDEITSTKSGGRGKGKLLSGMGRATSAPRSMPSSPAINAMGGSPSLGPVVSASQQAIERAKELRITLIHELAAQDRPFDYLEEKWTGKAAEFRPTLKKVADFNESTQKWTLAKTFWKELDVWNYKYETQALRQKAIDNATRQYDKMRLSTSQPQWELLLPKEERGKGKCLSRLQANLSKVSAAAAPMAQAPRIKVQKADEANDSSKDDSDAKGTPMARSSSNPLPAKRKIGDPTKKLLANGKKSTTPSRASPNKAKSSQQPAKGATTDKDGKRMLSEAYVVDSESDSEDQALAVKVKSAPRPKERPKEATAAASVVTQPPKPKAKPAAKPAPKPQATAKRRRDDEEESSSSGTPLSKRMKGSGAAKPLSIKAAAPVLKHRQSDASQKSRATNSGPTLKSKNTSPAKSSPLASSPPTNASDLSQEETPEPAPMPRPKKRTVSERGHDGERDRGRDRDGEKSKKQKREEGSVPSSLVDKAHRFKVFYDQYEALHYEMEALDHPPSDKMEKLIKMRGRLETMKNEIYKECSPRR